MTHKHSIKSKYQRNKAVTRRTRAKTLRIRRTQRGGEKQQIVVLSSSEIKVSAMKAIFPEEEFSVIPIKIPDNPHRDPQPIFISGTQEACAHRIKDYYTGVDTSGVQYYREDLPADTPVISIENGILSIDGEVICRGSAAARSSSNAAMRSLSDAGLLTAEDYSSLHWADFCVIGMARGRDSGVRFVISPEIIGIDRSLSGSFFRDVYRKLYNDKGELMFDTLGKYIASEMKAKMPDIKDNNWMLSVAGIDRVDQIKKGLRDLREQEGV